MRRKIISFRNLQDEIELIFLQKNKKPQKAGKPRVGFGQLLSVYIQSYA